MNAAYAVQWLWYGARLLFSMAYAVVEFFSKPGARWIVTTGLAVAAWVFFPRMAGFLVDVIVLLPLGDLSDALLRIIMLAFTGWWFVYLIKVRRGALPLFLLLLIGWGACLHSGTRDAVLSMPFRPLVIADTAALLALFFLAHWGLSRVLALVLGTFPPPPWPLRPRPVLKAKNRVIVPVPVTLAVPPLLRPVAGASYDVRRALPRDVATLLITRG